MVLFNIVVLCAIAAVSTLAASSPPSAMSETLVIVDTQETELGTLYFYGDAAWSNATEVTARGADACGSNDVWCDTSNVPNVDACASLLSGLQSNGGTFVGTYRAICLNLCGCTCGDSQCCVSWANDVSTLHEASLVNAANAVYGGCAQHGRSGLAKNVNLDGVCTIQCLSNRPDGCN